MFCTCSKLLNIAEYRLSASTSKLTVKFPFLKVLVQLLVNTSCQMSYKYSIKINKFIYFSLFTAPQFFVLFYLSYLSENVLFILSYWNRDSIPSMHINYSDYLDFQEFRIQASIQQKENNFNGFFVFCFVLFRSFILFYLFICSFGIYVPNLMTIF